MLGMTDETRPDDQPTDTASPDPQDTPDGSGDAPLALHPGETAGDPDTLIGDLTDPDVDVDALLVDRTDEEG